MKTMADIETTFRMELQQWFPKQCANIYDTYYLYYLPTTAEHDGGILICKDKPANPEYQLAAPQRINKAAEIYQIMNEWRPILYTLPILEIS